MTFASFRYLTDENIHPEVVSYVRRRGCDVATAGELGLHGTADEVILATAFQQQRVVLTHDSDFGTLVTAAGKPIYGVVYLRPGHIRPEFTIGTVAAVLDSAVDLNTPFLAVATRGDTLVRIRIRRLQSTDI